MARIACGNRCANPNVVAIYSHACPTGVTKKWSGPAEGSNPDGAPHPDPCPSDAMGSTVIAAICTTCGWVQP